MKIAIICNYKLFSDRIGGMDRFYVAYDKALKAKGHEVDWFFSGYEPFDFFKDLTIYADESKSVEALFLEHIKEESSYQTVVTHFVTLCTSFYKDVKKAGVKKIIAVDHNPRPINGFPLKKRVKNKIKGKLYGKYIDLFIGVSKYTTNWILKDYGNALKHKTEVIYNGIKRDLYLKKNKESKSHQLQFLVVSHLRKSKGIQDLLNAVALLSDENKKHFKIDVFGKGIYKDTLLKMNKDLGLESIIAFKGSSSNLKELFHNYDYMIQPTYMECFSLSILESLIANVPVITTTVGGNLEVVTHNVNGYIFEPGNINALKEIIENLISGEAAITENVATHIETNYNLEKMIDEHLNYID